MSAEIALPPSWFSLTAGKLRPRRVSAVAVVGIGCILLVGVVAPIGSMFTDDPNAISADVLQSPSSDHWFGTDSLGRDYFARVIHGSRLSMGLAVATMALATAIGLIVGVLSAYFKGSTDMAVQRLVDMLLALPGLLLVMFVVSAFGASVSSLTLSLCLLLAPGLSRVVRGSALVVVEEPYVEAARVMGASNSRVIGRHVLPNILPPVLVYASTGLGIVILAEGALSFLGLGVAPPTPSWGKMLSESRTYLRDPWLSIFPGVAITLGVLGFNLLGDVLRDKLDPRLRRR
jgi:peptide/nickel transport system permease protein